MQYLKINDLKWDDVNLLLAASRSSSLAEIANLLDLDKTTVSRRLTTMNDRVGSVLFARSRGRLKLTGMGEKLLPYAEEMEAAARGIEIELAQSRDNLSGEIRLSIPPTFARSIVAPNLSKFTALHPDVSIDLAVEPANVRLERWEADLAVRLDLPPDSEDTIVVRRLGKLAYAPYGPTGKKTSRQWITVGKNYAHVPEARWVEARLDGRMPILRTNDPEVAASAAGSGMGNVILPVLLGGARSDLRQLGPVALQRDLWLLRHRDMGRTALAQEVGNWLVALCKQILDA